MICSQCNNAIPLDKQGWHRHAVAGTSKVYEFCSKTCHDLFLSRHRLGASA